MPRKNEEQVLEYVNQLREQYAIGEPLAELPPDAPRSSNNISIQCPVAVALDKPCGTAQIALRGDLVMFPRFVTEFIEDHDRRHV